MCPNIFNDNNGKVTYQKFLYILNGSMYLYFSCFTFVFLRVSPYYTLLISQYQVEKTWPENTSLCSWLRHNSYITTKRPWENFLASLNFTVLKVTQKEYLLYRLGWRLREMQHARQLEEHLANSKHPKIIAIHFKVCEGLRSN